MTDGDTNGNTWKWTAKSEAAALALSEGKSYRVLAAEVGIGVTTLTRWVKVPEFQARVQEHIDANVAEARRILQRNAAMAAQRMVDFAFNASPQHSVRMAAAKDILDRVGLKAPEKHEHSGPEGQPLPPTIQVVAIDYRAAIAALAAGPDDDRLTPGEGESVIDGETVGEVGDGRRD